MTLAVVQCEQCGQLDDHPMVHILGGRSVHHDCLSASERAMVVGSSPVAAQIVEECEAGLHGDALRARIGELQAAADESPGELDEFSDQPAQADEQVEPPGGCIDCEAVDEPSGPLADEHPIPGDSAGNDESVEG